MSNLTLRVPTGVPLTNQQIDNDFQACNWVKGNDITASATITLTAGANYYDINGTSDISAIGAVNAGHVVRFHFKGNAATNGIVHSATSPGIYCNSSSTNILYKANDILTLVQETAATGGANALWRIQSYQKADGSAGQFQVNPTTLNNIVLQDGTGGLDDAGVGVYNLNRQVVTFDAATLGAAGTTAIFQNHSIVDENGDPAMPHEVHAYAVCTTSNGAWALGDMVPISQYKDDTSGSNKVGGTIRVNITPASRVYLVMAQQGWQIFNMSGSSAVSTLDDGNWKIEVHLLRYNPVTL